MFFKNVRLPHQFFSNRNVNKAENEIVLRLSNQQSYDLLDKIYNSPKCEKCKERFYSQEGLRGIFADKREKIRSSFGINT